MFRYLEFATYFGLAYIFLPSFQVRVSPSSQQCPTATIPAQFDRSIGHIKQRQITKLCFAIIFFKYTLTNIIALFTLLWGPFFHKTIIIIADIFCVA